MYYLVTSLFRILGKSDILPLYQLRGELQNVGNYVGQLSTYY